MDILKQRWFRIVAAVTGVIILAMAAFIFLSGGFFSGSDASVAYPGEAAFYDEGGVIVMDGAAVGGFARDDVYVDMEMVEMEEAPMMEPAMAPMPDQGFGGGGDMAVSSNSSVEFQNQQIERLIIRNGNISVQADDTRAAQVKVEELVNSMSAEGAFIVSREEYGEGQGNDPYISMQIRVPVDRFDDVMDSIAALAAEGTTPSRSESGQDVTEQYVDLAARLETLEAARDRLLELMLDANTTEELLMAEQQLTMREVEIESIKGRMQYLQQSAALSSIHVSLQPYFLSQPVDTTWRPAETFRRAVDRLVRSLRNFGDGLIYFVIFRLPWLIALGLFGLGAFRVGRWGWRKLRGNSALAGPPDES